MADIKKYTSRGQLIEELSFNITILLQQGLDERGAGSMLLSGGSTPGPLYEKLSETEFDWNKIWFAPTDERWVAPDHQDSNERLIRKSLIKNKASGANFVGLKSPGDDPRAGMQHTEQKLLEMPMPFDVTLLGMGEDGHFASLFPNLADTQVAMDMNNKYLCYPVRREGDEHDRMTITYRAILNSKMIILFFYGDNKLQVFKEASREVNNELPISHLLNQSEVPVTIFWAN